MTQRKTLLPSLAVFFVFGVGGGALAQWSDEAALNLAVADAAEEQAQPKVLARPGGGYYVSWFDNRSGGYDIYLQLLNEAGVKQWPQDGVLVADRSFSSTHDYGLGVDTDGNALLAFRDDRFSGTQVTAAKIDASGTLVWGANGVQLTSGTAYVTWPKIVGTTDGHSVVGWKNDTEVHLQRLDAMGTPVWAGVVTIADLTGREYSLSDLQNADAGSVIASLVFRPSGSSGPRHLHAQKISSAGAAQWGAAPAVVFDNGSLPFGSFPTFVSDGAGGAVFSWYSTSPVQCYAQHLDASGAEQFPHNGSAVSSSSRQHSNPDVAYDPSTASTYVVWREFLPAQFPLHGIYAQRFDATGAKQWGADGIVVEALSTTFVGSARVTLDDSDAMVAWARTQVPTPQTIVASKYDSSGAAVWSQLAVATAASNSSRLTAGTGPAFTVLGWSDDRAGQPDVFVQNVNPDGTLGASATGPGQVTGLRIGKGLAAPQLILTWGQSCSPTADYGVFEGTLVALRGGVYDHTPTVCTDSPPFLEETLAVPSGDVYYLVVPLDPIAEGSHGTSFDGVTSQERPVGIGQCAVTQTLGCP